VTDVYDQATATEELFRDHALARQRAKSGGPDVRNVACADCGGVIDPARRATVRNCRRCIDCERKNDIKLKLLKPT
jgi:RNA polymerase-binding transcription factor DksA